MKLSQRVELYTAIMYPGILAQRGDCALGLMSDDDLVDYVRSVAFRIANVPADGPDTVRARAEALWMAANTGKPLPACP